MGPTRWDGPGSGSGGATRTWIGGTPPALPAWTTTTYGLVCDSLYSAWTCHDHPHYPTPAFHRCPRCLNPAPHSPAQHGCDYLPPRPATAVTLQHLTAGPDVTLGIPHLRAPPTRFGCYARDTTHQWASHHPPPGSPVLPSGVKFL